MTCFKISYTCELTVVQTTSRTMITLYAIVLQAYVTIVLGLIQTLQKKRCYCLYTNQAAYLIVMIGNLTFLFYLVSNKIFYFLSCKNKGNCLKMRK